MSLLARLRSLVGIHVKGSIAPFDRFIDLGGSSSAEKLNQPYAKSLWVARAIKIVTDPITSVPLRFSTEERGREAIDDPELIEAWETPAIGPEGPMGWRDVVSATIGWLKLTGEAFWIFDDRVLVKPKDMAFPDVGFSAVPQFVIARPDRMRHVCDTSGRLVGWEFTDASGRKQTLLPEQVVHPKLWNPYDDIRGLGEYEQAKLAAESDYMGATFKLNLARNNGDQGVYIIAKSGIVNDQQRAQMIAQLREKRAMQQAGHFKPVFLTGDITIEDPKVRAVDGAFNESMMQDAHRIFIAFGVPPSMADVVPSYSVGSASDYYRLIRDTCVPAGVILSEAVEMAVRRQGRKKLFAWIDWSNHPVMKEVRREAIASATPLWDRGISWETINETFDLGLPEFEGWDERYLPFSVSPASSVQDVSNDAAGQGADVSREGDEGSEGEEEVAVTEMFRALRGGARRSARAARDPQEVELWKQHFARRKATAKLYLSRINKILFAARSEVLGKIEKSIEEKSGSSPVTLHSSPLTRAVVADFLFDLAAFKDVFTVSLRGVARNALQLAGQQLFDEVKQPGTFAMPEARAKKFLATRDQAIESAAGNIGDAIRAELQKSLDGGESIREMGQRVRAKFNEISKGRSEVIAMTETGAAYGEARQEALEQAGITHKKWLTSGLPNVRTAHAEANGQIVRTEEFFVVDGENLEHPGDSTHGASAGNTINCHCVSVAVRDPEA